MEARRGTHLLSVLDSHHLVLEDRDLLVGAARGDRVDDDEALAVADPLVAQGRELLLAGGIEDLKQTRGLVDDDLLAVRVLDRRVVLLDEVVGAELDGLERCGRQGGALALSVSREGRALIVASKRARCRADDHSRWHREMRGWRVCS